MQIDKDRLEAVLRRVGGKVYGNYCEASVTIGEVSGVVYRVVAMDALMAEDKDCTDGPDWAVCVTPNAALRGGEAVPLESTVMQRED